MPVLTLSAHNGLDQRARVPSGFIGEAENLDMVHDGFLVMRQGCGAEATTGTAFNSALVWLARFITTAGVSELWAASSLGTSFERRVAGTFNAVTTSDAITSLDAHHSHAATLNGKFFIAYNSAVNRLHVWDGTNLRKVGLIVPAVPVTATQGGSGLTFTRHYRVRWVHLSGSTVVRRSEPGPSDDITITDDAGVTVTRPTAAGEGETHWEVEYADASSGPWYRASQVVIATTTYSDTAATISTANLSAESGQYYPPPSAKYLLSDGTRLLMAGAWESSAAAGETAVSANRVWFTPRLGTTDEGDDERLPDTADLTSYIDIGDNAAITGLAGPLNGSVYVFKTESTWKLTPTGNIFQPYRADIVSPSIGAIGQRAIVMGSGVSGEPCIYFAQANTIYRLSGGGGIQVISDPIQLDLRRAGFSATSSGTYIAFDPPSQQLYVQFSTTAPATAGTYARFLMGARSGRWSGFSATNTIGLSAAVYPASDGIARLMLGGAATTTPILTSLGTALAHDNTTEYTSRVRWRGVVAEGRRVSLGNPIVTYRNPQGAESTVATLTLTMYREDGTSRSQALTLTALTASDPLAIRSLVFEGLEAADTYVLDLRVELAYSVGFTGDVLPGVDIIQIPYKVQEKAAA